MHRSSPQRRARGFTLIEIAVVLFILGLLIAGVIGPLETQLEARDRRQTTQSMENIIESLYGYAISNGRLPCPNVDGDGAEALDTDANGTDDYEPAEGFTAEQLAAGGLCLQREGFVPWTTLGVDQGDAWGNRFTYRVSDPTYTRVDTDGVCNGATLQEYDLCATIGALDVDSRGDDPSSGGTIEGKFVINLADSLPAVVISHGKNGLGATSVGGVVQPGAAANTDELENTNNDNQFISRTYSATNAACADDQTEATPLCAFDDLLMWVSSAILNNRMVTAGRLP